MSCQPKDNMASYFINTISLFGHSRGLKFKKDEIW